MKDTDETAFLNSLFMDFTSENELELFLKSLDEVCLKTFILAYQQQV